MTLGFEGFLPLMRAVFYPKDLRGEMWLAALEPVHGNLVADGLDDELLEETFVLAQSEVNDAGSSGLIRDTDVDKVQGLLGNPFSRESAKSVARRSHRYSRSIRTISMEARTASMRFDLMRNKHESYRSGAGRERVGTLIQAFLVISEQHEYKQGLDSLVVPLLETMADDKIALPATSWVSMTQLVGLSM